MSLLDEIRNQPEGIRKTMFGLSVAAVLALSGMVWFQAFRNNVYALLNPPAPSADDSGLARESDQPEVQSPFAALGSVFKEMTANISGIFTDRLSPEADVKGSASLKSGKAQPLPVSE